MRFTSRLAAGLRALFMKRRVERDLDDEVRAFADEIAERHERGGWSPRAARRLAMLEVGGVEQVKEQVRDVRVGSAIETTLLDARYAWRALWKSPAFALAVTLTLALGIGANAAIFSIVKALLIDPLPYRDADRLVFVWADLTSAGYPRGPLAGPELHDLRERSRLFEGFGGIWANTVALTGEGEPEQLRIGLVTTNFFDVLGASALVGRTFTRDDETIKAPSPMLLSHALWRRRFGGDPSVVGRRILVNGVPVTVIGVMPPSFTLLMPPDASVPDDLQAWRLLSPTIITAPRGQQFLRVVGRMRRGVMLEDAQREIAAIGDQIGRAFVDYGGSGWRLYGVPLQAESMRDVRPAVLALYAGVSILLLIACVNVANLLVARATARRGETALRMALGAGRGRLFRQCLIEGLLLAALGALCALPVATVVLRTLLALRPEMLSRIDAARLDPRVLGFTAAIALTWGLAFSLAPLAAVLRTNVRGMLPQRINDHAFARRYGLRGPLVVLQIALGAVLLVSTGLLLRTVVNLQRVNAGFSSRHVMTFRVAPGPRFRTPDALNGFTTRLKEELTALPGVQRVAAISHLPYDNLPNWSTPYLPEGVADRSLIREADSRAITPGFFETVHARLVDGRDFTDGDDPTKPFVAIVDERFAARAWPGQSAVGKRFTGDPLTRGAAATPVTVIGVVAHLRHRVPTEEVREQIYFAERQVFRSPMAYVLATSPETGSVSASAIRAAVERIDATLPIFDVRPLDEYVASARAVRRFTTQIATTFAALALLLGSVGVYGLVSYAAATRRQELGVRLALGARPSQVVRLVMMDGVRLAAAGLLIGLLAASRAASLLHAQLFGVTPHDPVSYLAAIPVLAVAALVACWLPARRATMLNPLDVLRNE
jgi:predicted permease